MHATMRFHIDDSSPRLTGLVRMHVFASVERTKGRGKRARTKTIGVAWSGWNDDSRMEQRCARLAGSGSFYWSGAITALDAAKRMMCDDSCIHQIALEDISGRPIGRLYRDDKNDGSGEELRMPSLADILGAIIHDTTGRTLPARTAADTVPKPEPASQESDAERAARLLREGRY